MAAYGLLVNNRPGVLSHVAGLIARRNINIECLNVGYTEIPEISRINLVVGVESRFQLDQAIHQLSHLIDVIKVVNLDDAPLVSYELTLIKVSAPTPQIRGTDQHRQSVPRQDCGCVPGFPDFPAYRPAGSHPGPEADAPEL